MADRAVPAEVLFERDGVRLAGLDYGGDGPSVLLLHGLAGHAGEWAETAGWLTERCRVVALDARGHGRSERLAPDVSPGAHVADAVFAVEQLALDPVVLVGQSLGGRTALLLAAAHPDLVRGLVVADASPHGGDAADVVEADLAELDTSLRRWPVPFASRDRAVEFFGGPSLNAEAWADGLELRDGGWWPRFDVEVMVRTLREAASRSHWEGSASRVRRSWCAPATARSRRRGWLRGGNGPTKGVASLIELTLRAGLQPR